jgi:hypothetical protein
MSGTNFTEDELIRRATTALRVLGRDGVVTLKNTNGILAAYKVTDGGQLRRLKSQEETGRAAK